MAQKFDSAIRFFLYVLVFWLPYSSAVVETCVVISLVLWITKRLILLPWKSLTKLNIREQGRVVGTALAPAHSSLNQAISCFLIFCILSLMGSLFVSQSVYGFFTKTLEWFVIYFLVLEVFTEAKHFYHFLFIFILTGLATVIDSLYQYYISSKDIFLGNVIDPRSRATAGFNTSSDLGGFLTFFVSISLAIVLISKEKKVKILSLLLFISALWALMVTFTRGAWIAVAIGIVFFIVLLCFFDLKKFSLRKRWIFPIFILLALSLYPLVSINNGTKIFSQDRFDTMTWRWQVWRDTLTMINERPFLGHGLNTYMKIFQEYRVETKLAPTYAHNGYLQIAAETGWLGLLSYLCIIYCMFRSSMKTVFRKEDIVWKRNFRLVVLGLVSGALAFLILSFFDTNFYSLRQINYFWFMVGILISLNKILDKSFPYDINKVL